MLSVEQIYFIVSGTVTRASSQIWKKLSMVVREVKITAVWSRIFMRWLRNSLGVTPITLISGLYSISTPRRFEISKNGDFSTMGGAGCATRILLMLLLISSLSVLELIHAVSEQAATKAGRFPGRKDTKSNGKLKIFVNERVKKSLL